MPLRSLEFEARLAWSRQTNIQEILEVFLHVLRWGEGLETNFLIGSTFFKSSTHDLEFWGNTQNRATSQSSFSVWVQWQSPKSRYKTDIYFAFFTGSWLELPEPISYK
jgi:hypothetical protein